MQWTEIMVAHHHAPLKQPNFLCCSECFLRRLCQAVAVEKPVAASVEDILECHKICAANDVPLYCSFQRLIAKRRPVCLSSGGSFETFTLPTTRAKFWSKVADVCMWMNRPQSTCIRCLEDTRGCTRTWWYPQHLPRSTADVCVAPSP